MYKCVCVCVYVFVCLCVWIGSCVFELLYMCICIFMYKSLFARVCVVCVHEYVCMGIYVHVCVLFPWKSYDQNQIKINCKFDNSLTAYLIFCLNQWHFNFEMKLKWNELIMLEINERLTPSLNLGMVLSNYTNGQFMIAFNTLFNS